MNFIRGYAEDDPEIKAQHALSNERDYKAITCEKFYSIVYSLIGKSCPVFYSHPEILGQKENVCLGRVENCEKIEFSLVHQSVEPEYDYLFQVNIDLSKAVLKIVCRVLHNGVPLIAKKKGPVESLLKLALYYVNCRIEGETSFRVNPLDGSFKVCSINHFSKKQFASNFFLPHTFVLGMKQKIMEIKNFFDNRLLGKILIALNLLGYEVPLEEKKNEKNQNSLFKKLQENETCAYQEMEACNKKINRYITLSDLDFLFFKKKENDQFVVKYFEFPFGGKENSFIIRPVKARRKAGEVSSQNMNIIGLYEGKMQLKYQPIVEEITDEEINEFRLMLDVRKFNKSPFTVETDIILHAVKPEAQQFANGGFTNIYKIGATITEKPQRQRVNTLENEERKRQLVMVKKEEIRDSNRIWWEKVIVQQMGKHSCLFIPRYFNPVEDESTPGLEIDKCILMEYNPEKSLNIYLSLYSKFISLNTKVFFLYQIAQSLRYIRDFGIVHLDLKPENLLARIMHYQRSEYNKIVLKLIDYGESYCKANLNPNSKGKGYTIPYAPPEQFKDRTLFQEKSDVFSLGMIILLVVFESNTNDIKRAGPLVFRDNDNYLDYFSMCHEKCKLYGPEFLSSSLLRLAYKCIDPIEKYRPMLDWVTIILKEMSNFLEQLHF